MNSNQPDFARARSCAPRRFAAVALVFLAACSDLGGGSAPTKPNDNSPPTKPNDNTPGQNGPSSPPAETGAALVSLRSCNDVEQAVRAAALRAMSELLDRQLETAFEQLDAKQCWFGGRYGELGAPGGAGVFGGVLGPSNAPAAEAQGPTDVSETNNQVSGVDEPDLVKNDDRFLYIVAQGALHILEAWPAAQTKLVARVALPPTPKRLLLQGDRLLVFSSVARSGEELSRYQPWARSGGGECTYGYDCDFTGDGNGTRISVFDVTDRSSPALLRTIETRATFLSARRIGSAVHTVLYEEPELLKTLPVYPKLLESGGLCTGVSLQGTAPNLYEQPVPAEGDRERAERLFNDLRAENLAAIEAAPIEQLLSKVEDQQLTDETCAGFYDSPQADGTAFLSLLSLDLSNDEPVQTSTIVSRPGASYASADSYYISVRQQHAAGYGWYDGLDDAEEVSTIHKFDLAGSGNRYAASGVVKGRVLNQFSMDEYGGHLRIATTSGHLPSPEAHSTVSVLAQRDSALELVGQVDQIAKTEDIRSVRFDGDARLRGHVQEDRPAVRGRPGRARAHRSCWASSRSRASRPTCICSTTSHLLTIGYDADDQGDFAWFRGRACCRSST